MRVHACTATLLGREKSGRDPLTQIRRNASISRKKPIALDALTCIIYVGVAQRSTSPMLRAVKHLTRPSTNVSRTVIFQPRGTARGTQLVNSTRSMLAGQVTDNQDVEIIIPALPHMSTVLHSVTYMV